MNVGPLYFELRSTFSSIPTDIHEHTHTDIDMEFVFHLALVA